MKTITIALLFLFSLPLSAQFGGKSVQGGKVTLLTSGGGPDATNTQALLRYTAPSASACTVEVSESVTYSPLVNDVNSTLFSGSDSDGGGSLQRLFVVGKRLSATASDMLVYSRALQANTQHYYRVTCGATVLTGSFNTKNIPLNSTYQDIPQLDPANPGATITPTVSDTDRTQVIIDPHTGAKLKRVSLPGDSPYDPMNSSTTGAFLNFSGNPRVCGASTTGPDGGYLCAFPQGGGGPQAMYYIIPTTGEVRYLGYGPFVGIFNASDNKFYGMSGNAITQRAYTGDWSGSGTSGTFASLSTSTLVTDLPSDIAALNSAFTPANFECNVDGASFDYLYIGCYRFQKDSYAYAATMEISTHTVKGAARLDDNIRCRWCAMHQIVPIGYNEPVLELIPHAFASSGSVLGQGAYTTTITSGINSSVTTIPVAGEPTCTSTCGSDTDKPIARVGDVFSIGSERIQITTKTSPTSWIVTRGYGGTTAASHSSADAVNPVCNATIIMWKFLGDPLGTDTTNTSWVQDTAWYVSSHDDSTTDIMIGAADDGWVIRAGDIITNVGQSVTRLVTAAVTFAGASTNCYGNACRKHPSVGPPGTSWYSDFPLWDYNAGVSSPFMTNVSGQVYRLTDGVGSSISPKHFAIAGAVGSNRTGSGAPHAFLDVSPAVLSTGAGDSYKMCIANAANECFSGSTVGQVYLNIPGSPTTTCTNVNDTCVINFDPLANGAVQIGTTAAVNRVVTGGLAALRQANDYPTAKTLADGSWLMFAYRDVEFYPPSQVLMAKLTPFTAGDSVDRTTFVRAPIAIATPQGVGITTATVEFGYLENGAVASHYCTSRTEACVAVSSTVTDATPFYFTGTDTYSRLSCATSCTITLPVLPTHVAYYTVKFYDAGGAFVQNGSSGVAVEGTVR